MSTRLRGSGPSGAPPGAIAWPVERAPSPAIAADRVSCTTRFATPSSMRGSGDFATPSASKARGRVLRKRGESDRLIAAAATRVPRRPERALRPSAWARPLKASAPRNSSSVPTASGSSTAGYSPGASSAGSSEEAFAAASCTAAAASRSPAAVEARAAKPVRPPRSQSTLR